MRNRRDQAGRLGLLFFKNLAKGGHLGLQFKISRRLLSETFELMKDHLRLSSGKEPTQERIMNTQYYR